MDDFLEWFGRISLIALILIAFNSMLGDILFRIKYSFPHVSEITEQTIDFSKEPVQTNLKNEKFIKYRGEKNNYVLIYYSFDFNASIISTFLNFICIINITIIEKIIVIIAENI